MDTQHKDDMAMDEKFVENAEKKQEVTVGSTGDAALTRRILLKLDFRYGCGPSLRISMETDTCMHQNLARACPPFPLFLPRSHECRKCKDVWFGGESEDDRLPVRHWLDGILCYVYCKACCVTLTAHTLADDPAAKSPAILS